MIDFNWVTKDWLGVAIHTNRPTWDREGSWWEWNDDGSVEFVDPENMDFILYGSLWERVENGDQSQSEYGLAKWGKYWLRLVESQGKSELPGIEYPYRCEKCGAVAYKKVEDDRCPICGWFYSLEPVKKKKEYNPQEGNSEIWENYGLKSASMDLAAEKMPDWWKVKDNEGVKFDEGKLRMDLLPPEAIEALAGVLTMGAAKYGDRNWEKGMNWGRCTGALLRHLFAWMRGEDIDPESGLNHMDHVLCNAAFLVTFIRRNIGTDDRK